MPRPVVVVVVVVLRGDNNFVSWEATDGRTMSTASVLCQLCALRGADLEREITASSLLFIYYHCDRDRRSQHTMRFASPIRNNQPGGAGTMVSLINWIRLAAQFSVFVVSSVWLLCLCFCCCFVAGIVVDVDTTATCFFQSAELSHLFFFISWSSY